MFLTLDHTKLKVFSYSEALVLEAYRLTKSFPVEEKFVLVQQIRRAALSVHLNIAEGASRRSPAERKRFFEISRGSLIEIDTAVAISIKLDYIDIQQLSDLGTIIVSTFKLLTGIMNAA